MPTLAELLQRSRLRVDPRLEGMGADEIRALLSGRHPVDVDATLPGGLEAHASFLRGMRPKGVDVVARPTGARRGVGD